MENPLTKKFLAILQSEVDLIKEAWLTGRYPTPEQNFHAQGMAAGYSNIIGGGIFEDELQLEMGDE